MYTTLTTAMKSASSLPTAPVPDAPAGGSYHGDAGSKFWFDADSSATPKQNLFGC